MIQLLPYIHDLITHMRIIETAHQNKEELRIIKFFKENVRFKKATSGKGFWCFIDTSILLLPSNIVKIHTISRNPVDLQIRPLEDIEHGR